MLLPTLAECLDLFTEYLVPECIYRHCVKTSRAAVALAGALARKGVPIDVRVVEIGCLLHDMMKLYSLDSLIPKPEVGYYGATDEEASLWRDLRPGFTGLHETEILHRVLKSRFPEFADFALRIGSTGNPTYLDGPIELKVIHYADWRIEVDYFVPLQKRLDYLGQTYRHKWQQHGSSWWDDMVDRERTIEHELFAPLGMSPDDFASMTIRRANVQEHVPSDWAEAVSVAAELVRHGGVIIYPAKNGYMIGANPFDRWAIGKVFKMKRRPSQMFLPCLVADIHMVESYICLTEEEKQIAQSLMPGPLLLIGDKNQSFPDTLSEEGFTFTVARTDIGKALLEEMNQPLVATSCNISGNPVCLKLDGVDPHILNYVDFIFDAGELPHQPDYTVAKLSSEGPVVKREGLIDKSDIQALLDKRQSEVGRAKYRKQIRDRVFVMEELLNVMTLDPRVKQLWLRKFPVQECSDFSVLVVTEPAYASDVYISTDWLFSRRDDVTSNYTTHGLERQYEFVSGIRLSIRYGTASDGVTAKGLGFRIGWERPAKSGR